MSMRSLWLLPALTGSAAAQPLIDFGLPLSEQTIQRYAISVYPDGRNLPPGQGSVLAGGELYAGRCASCHGAKGKEKPQARNRYFPPGRCCARARPGWRCNG